MNCPYCKHENQLPGTVCHGCHRYITSGLAEDDTERDTASFDPIPALVAAEVISNMWESIPDSSPIDTPSVPDSSGFSGFDGGDTGGGGAGGDF